METNEWQRFLQTGKVTDYLAYREKASAVFVEENGQRRENTVNHAGFCNSDGNDITGISHGRI